MRLLAFSDVHCDLEACAALVAAASDADLVIGAGDYAQMHDGLAPTMDALAPLAGKAVLIPGNNETDTALRAATAAMVIHCETVTRGGLVIAGIGCAVPPLPPHVGSFDMTEDAAAQVLDAIPAADILVTHSPPAGIADRLRDGRRVGSHAVRAAIVRLQPRLVLCGHIHDCWGEEGRIGASWIRNLGPRPNWVEI
ncbi:serine/threonine protein phosphatase [Mesobaculum littorinae]|uniref:Serine/threonine protein phosphatase n=1 Tax=Mesobaculum littorinae TaxID=2486419 RepID=A0A438AI76_9RHOB|nr:metallophosphoesterase family protein [Mesobaculum littorinae]RVV98354.1 serine/threonine protein phosphatase [Mesobaculum littorinae]